MAAQLRAVKPDEKPTPAKKHTVKSAAAEGDQLDILIAMRDRIATAVSDEKCPPRDLAALTKRLDDIVDKIAALKARAAEESDGDEGTADDEGFDASAI